MNSCSSINSADSCLHIKATDPLLSQPPTINHAWPMPNFQRPHTLHMPLLHLMTAYQPQKNNFWLVCLPECTSSFVIDGNVVNGAHYCDQQQWRWRRRKTFSPNRKVARKQKSIYHGGTTSHSYDNWSTQCLAAPSCSIDGLMLVWPMFGEMIIICLIYQQ